jgi:hypothetical protein
MQVYGQLGQLATASDKMLDVVERLKDKKQD